MTRNATHEEPEQRIKELEEQLMECRQAKEALRTLVFRNEAILAAVPDIIMEVDVCRRYTWANHAGLRFFGEDVVGREASSYFEGEQEIYDKLRPLFDGGEEVIYVESWQRRQDGEKRLLSWWCKVLKDEQGRVTGALSSARDITDQKRAEEALRESQTKLQAIFNTVGAGIIIIDRDTQTIIDANQTAIEMTGLPQERIIGQICHSLVCPAQAGKCPVKDLGQSVDHSEKKLLCANGHQKDILKTVYPITIKGRDYYLESFIDISDRLRAKELLKESEERFRKIFEEAHLGIVITSASPSLEFEKANPAFCRMMGYSADELRSMTFADITHPDHLKQDRENVDKVGRGELPFYQTEKRYINKNGSGLWGNVIVSSIRDEHGALQYFLSMVNDITERRQAEEMLREQLHFLQQLLDAIPIPIFYKDRQGMFRGANRAYEKFVGMTKDQIVGKTVFGVAPQDLANIYYQADEALFGRPGAQVYETSFLHADGNRHDIVFNKATYVGTDGCVAGLVGAILDITERKRAEEEKRSLQSRLQRSEKMEALGQLAGGVAHDLNNVLGILSGYSELLLEEIPQGHRSRNHVEKILQSTEKGAAIIQDLLTLARRGVMAADVLSLNDIVSGFLKTPVFDKMKDYHPRVTFMTECDRNLLNIKGSPVHLEKALMNLVSNAAESITGEGEVTIRTENRYLDKAIGGYDEVREGDYTVLSVSDTGTGIPAENREKIFEPFYTKKTMGRSGTGLGLSIVWGTVKDHNGYIDLQTHVGDGTTFTLYFPATRDELIAPQLKVPIERYRGNGESVLVVDDVAEQRDVASRLLTRLGYAVHTASSGEEAVEYLKGNKADILVLDMIMVAGIDGLETYQRVLEINPRQKAILVSGFSETERVREAQKLGAGAYVKKPFLMEKIGVTIRDELNDNRLC
jgi:two-component system, cell cycle sensor histidine kinase and response regulator CckA